MVILSFMAAVAIVHCKKERIEKYKKNQKHRLIPLDVIFLFVTLIFVVIFFAVSLIFFDNNIDKYAILLYAFLIMIMYSCKQKRFTHV